ncbi:MAG: hypothetical protein J6K82_00455 [Alphaproteobacteria bacterium]|nr:hypothetical protein [Alphaproteobacteria bacterium]
MGRKYLLFAILSACFITSANAAFTSCGAGYVLVESRNKIDGVPSAECQKLWCRDLENGKQMGSDDKANSGYQMTPGVVELCDAKGNCVECWGERKWCGGEARGEWNPEYGAYTRGGDNSTYESYQKGSCFAWRLEKPSCPEGETAILKSGQWVCAVSSGTTEASRSSAIRRTGTLRRITR